MAASEKEKTPEATQMQIRVAQEPDNVEGQDSVSLQFSQATESLMPELEELVKKNPNRLIGCGG